MWIDREWYHVEIVKNKPPIEFILWNKKRLWRIVRNFEAGLPTKELFAVDCRCNVWHHTFTNARGFLELVVKRNQQ